ncbi:NifU family protein [Patescibacteria group bacterium]|nr:MAG: NifU family protein [Patescibacteria group bacterium]
MRERVEAVLADIRPSLAMHGGDISFVDCDLATGIVKVRLQGACVGCPMSAITLKMGVEAALMDAVPEVREVIAIDG